MPKSSIIKICIFLFAALFCIHNRSYGQYLTISEMKAMAKASFSQTETIALKGGYSYERTYRDNIPEELPTQEMNSEFRSLDGSSFLVKTTTTYRVLDKNGIIIKNAEPRISYSVRLSFNNPNLLEKYKTYLKDNNYKQDSDVAFFERIMTKYKDASDKNFDVTLVRFDEKVKYRYYVLVTVNPY